MKITKIATKVKSERDDKSAIQSGLSGLSGLRMSGLGLVVIVGLTCLSVSGSPALAQDITPCATVGTLANTAVSGGLVASQDDKLVIAIRPDQPRVGRPVIAWIVGHQPGHLLVARQVSWKFNNAANMLKASGGGSSSTVYLTPGQKKISVSVTDMAGKRQKATCSFEVTW